MQPFEQQCDALKVDISTVLSKIGRPMAHFNEKFLGLKSRYNIFDMVFYAIIQSIQH